MQCAAAHGLISWGQVFLVQGDKATHEAPVGVRGVEHSRAAPGPQSHSDLSVAMPRWMCLGKPLVRMGHDCMQCLSDWYRLIPSTLAGFKSTGKQHSDPMRPQQCR
jgi:hypothetical protein